ncbi:MAG: alanine dehydrogenase [Bacteroidia bacterium]
MGNIKYGVESELFPGLYAGSWAIPKEQVALIDQEKSQLTIGIPKEHFFQENRTPLIPEAIRVLVDNGHRVYIQSEAGAGARFTDVDFADAGATIKHSTAEIYQCANYILKVTPLSDNELELLRDNQTIISPVHLGSLSPEMLEQLMKKNVTAVGFEFYQSEDDSLPFVQMMSEIAGVSSINVAAELLSSKNDGQGQLLGGITGIPPAEITIIGAGTVGFHAARTAMAMGARVRIIDQEVSRLRRIVRELGAGIYTSVAQYNYIYDAVVNSDVVIGAAFSAGSRAPLVVTEEMVKGMRSGSVIIDVSIDQGGCVATSRATNHDHPTFIEHGVIHYCVPNIPSRVARTASTAISNVLAPLLLNIGESGGISHSIKTNEALKQGIYIYRHHLTKKTLARLFNMSMKYRDIGLLIATL